MKKNYYFVIGQKNLMVAEAVKLLQENNAPFRCLEEPYIFTKDEEDELIKQGYEPYYVNVAYRSSYDGYYQINDSFLYKLYQMLEKKCTIYDMHYDVMMLCLGTYTWDWLANLRRFIQLGYAKTYVQKMQTENRLALGIDEQAEKMAEQAVNEALKNSVKPYDYLVVRWNYPVKNCDFECFLPVLDRVFWVQHFVNVLILTPNNAFYYGGQKTALEIFRNANCSTFCFEFSAGALYTLNEDSVNRAVKVLQDKTTELRKTGLLW